MIRSAIILFCLLTAGGLTRAQLCPGGGLNYNNAVLFDPAWIYGCNTGSSCNGGVNFDNRSSCEPTLALDACSASPTCVIPTQTESDIWFKFYPSFSNVTISCIQNTSMVIGIQAFSGGTCGGLTQIGCALAGGPSSGVQLNLTGLIPGQLYYFRIYGSSHSNPQRSGIYCFCGTTGIQASFLPLSLETLKAVPRKNAVELSFQRPSSDDIGTYEIEHSTDGTNFQSIYRLANQGNSKKVVFMHNTPGSGLNYYRLKRSNGIARQYSTLVLKINYQSAAWQIAGDQLNKRLVINIAKPTAFSISDISGRIVRSSTLSAGLHHLSVASLSPGIYIAHNRESDQSYKFIVTR